MALKRFRHHGGPCLGYHDITEIIDFKANYSGRVIVSGTTNSTSGYIYLEQYNSTSGSTVPIFDGSASIGSGQDAYFNITPGHIYVYLGNTNVTSAASGILTVVYNY